MIKCVLCGRHTPLHFIQLPASPIVIVIDRFALFSIVRKIRFEKCLSDSFSTDFFLE